MTMKLHPIATFTVPEDWRETTIVEYKDTTTKPREFIAGVVENVIEIEVHEKHGHIDVVYVNGARYVPEKGE